MNRIFLKNVLGILDTRMCLNQEENFYIGEDMAIAFCASWFSQGTPYEARDKQNRWRFQYDTPAKVYETWGDFCCSPEAISFHKIDTPEMMHYLDAQLHECRDDLVSRQVVQM